MPFLSSSSSDTQHILKLLDQLLFYDPSTSLGTLVSTNSGGHSSGENLSLIVSVSVVILIVFVPGILLSAGLVIWFKSF